MKNQAEIEAVWEKSFNSENPFPWWNCPDCGDSLFSVQIDGQWYEKDTSVRGAKWEEIPMNIKPDWDGVQCHCSE